jgi:predicted phage replisome organizer
MSESKKYYWLKLKNDFFTSREIKKLRGIAGGDTFTIIYLKMQLLSLKDEGSIHYEGTEDDITEQLSIELDEDRENVALTLSYLQKNNMLELLSENEYLLNRVPECIGKETVGAERKRIERQRKKVGQIADNVQKRHTEIEIEIETDKEKHVEKKPMQATPARKSNLNSIEQYWHTKHKDILGIPYPETGEVIKRDRKACKELDVLGRFEEPQIQARIDTWFKLGKGAEAQYYPPKLQTFYRNIDRIKPAISDDEVVNKL